jgi:AraC family transcriptional regulator of adaptative response / DNA-3-methyladenine glycosylase II
VFPDPDALADARDGAFSMPTARRDTVRRMAAAIAEGSVELHAGADSQTARQQLLQLKGVGPWTADYVVMRALGHPDTFLATDLGVRHALDAMRMTVSDSATWAPWRSYAVHHLWASLG